MARPSHSSTLTTATLFSPTTLFTHSRSFLLLLLSFLLLLSTFSIPTASALDPSPYPRPGEIPATDSPLASEWLQQLDLSAAPTILPNKPGHECPSPITNNPNLDPTVCNFACSRCALNDIVTCPVPNSWGLTFDGGPSESTGGLLDILKENNLKATFFFMGGSVVERPDVVKRLVNEGHHLASLTWSHTPLTTLTNAQIVVEVKWTEKAIEDITGQKVKYIRPPNGDIDNRVRFVLRKLNYTIVEWSGEDYDTRDIDVVMKEKTTDEVVSRFQKTLSAYTSPTNLPTQGFITLAHDISPETVAVTKELIFIGIQSGLKIQSIASCLQDNWPYSSPQTPGAGGANPEGLLSRLSDASAPPSGHVDYNDYFTMEGQLLNKLIAQAKGQGFPAVGGAGGGHGSFGRSLLLLDGGSGRLAWTLFGSIIAGLIIL